MTDTKIDMTLEEKVDFLYNQALTNEKRRKRKLYYWVMIILLSIGYSYYMMLVLLPLIQKGIVI